MWRTAFRAMNTTVELHLAGGDAADRAAVAVRGVFGVYERTLSRFLRDSALSRINAGAGVWHPAPPLLLDAVAAALRWAHRFPGLFDPTVLSALRSAGYDRSFEQVPHDREAAAAATSTVAEPLPGTAALSTRGSRPDAAGSESATRTPGPRGIAVDRAGGRLFLPTGVALDLGGIGKGLAVDAAVAAAAPAGSRWSGILCNAGGDLLARGEASDGPWRVGVDDPLHPGRDLAVVALRDAALATSSTRRRRWRVAGEDRHHLIDPANGRPSRSGVAQATAVARSAVEADVLAKVLVLGGPERAPELLAEVAGAAALVVLECGRTLPLGGWKEIEAHAVH